MATPAPSPTSPASRVRSETARGEYSKRTILLSALALALILIGGVAVVAVTSDGSPKVGEAGVSQSQDGQAKPESIPLPGSGKAPENAAERGGSEQLAVFGIMAGAMLFIGAVVFRGGKKARRGRKLWLDAAATGHDGAVARQGELAPDVALSSATAAPGPVDPPA